MHARCYLIALCNTWSSLLNSEPTVVKRSMIPLEFCPLRLSILQLVCLESISSSAYHMTKGATTLLIMFGDMHGTPTPTALTFLKPECHRRTQMP